MSEDRKCFAATSGSYSDYSVHCVFERREDAQAYCDKHNSASGASPGYQVEVEEFDYYPSGVVPFVDREHP